MATNTTNERYINIRKSPIDKLKEDLEELRQKNSENELIIKEQHDEIMRLKEAIAAASSTNKCMELKTQVEKELLQKSCLQQKLNLVIAEKEKLSTDIFKEKDELKIQIEQLQLKLKTNEDVFHKKEEEHKRLIQEKDKAICKLRLKKEEMIKAHQLQIQRENQQCKKPEVKIDDLIEQALKEFEQEQYNFPPQPSSPQQFFTLPMKPSAIKRTINQQWYAQKYMPVDAISWPKPEILPNFKKIAKPSAFTI